MTVNTRPQTTKAPRGMPGPAGIRGPKGEIGKEPIFTHREHMELELFGLMQNEMKFWYRGYKAQQEKIKELKYKVENYEELYPEYLL